jgi:hypothetical protein
MTITFTAAAAAAGGITWLDVPGLSNGADITLQGPIAIGGSSSPVFATAATLELKSVAIGAGYQLVVSVAGAHLKLTNCTVAPVAAHGATQVTASNGAMLTVKDTAFGGGEFIHAILAEELATVLIERSSFSGFCRSNADRGVVEAASGASLTLRSSVLANNILGTLGVALKAHGGASLALEASTLYDNEGTTLLLGLMGGAGLYCNGASTACRVHNSVVWDDRGFPPGPRVAAVNSAVAIVTYSDIKGGGWPGASNIEADPGFSGLVFPNFLPGVNLADKGDPIPDLANPLDFAGNARVQGAAQDIGAFEAAPSTRKQCGGSMRVGVGVGVGFGVWGWIWRLKRRRHQGKAAPPC